MKTNLTNRICSCAASPCCPASVPTNLVTGGAPDQNPAWGHPVAWTDGLRPFLGFYVFKG